MLCFHDFVHTGYYARWGINEAKLKLFHEQTQYITLCESVTSFWLCVGICFDYTAKFGHDIGGMYKMEI